MERTLVAFTIILFANAPAHASHPPLTARIAVAPKPQLHRSVRAETRTIYLNRDGAVLWPGDNDARLQTSSIVSEPAFLTPWEIDDDTWAETVACVAEIYRPFDVTITDEDPGEDVPHVEAVFGGHPADLGLPDNVAGISPFTTDCSVIENSVVFTFTDVLPDDSRLMCEVMAQEIAHSFGLDHQMLPEDPMTYLDYDGERSFQDETSACGEYEDRPCGIDQYRCPWQRQNSVQLLGQRLGWRSSNGAQTAAEQSDATAESAAGCSASGAGSARGSTLLLLLALIRSVRRAGPGRRGLAPRCTRARS